MPLFFWFRLAMMDLVVAMVAFVDRDTMTKTFALIRPYLEVRNGLVGLDSVT